MALYSRYIHLINL